MTYERVAIASKTIFGFDLGTNSIGWAVLREVAGQAESLEDAGVRIFNKAVEDKTPTPKNHARRRARLARRVLQRRARRRQRLQNYLISLGLLPIEVRDSSRREAVLNDLGDPYLLRAQALDGPLTPYQLGRALLHLGMRRGFQSNRRTLLSDMADDPDVLEVLAEMEHESEDGKTEADKQRIKEEGEFKAAISALQSEIEAVGARTLGEYLMRLSRSCRKRNRRTGRSMVRHELDCILAAQARHHPALSEAVCQELGHIIFHQRPLRWDANSIGACSLEPQRRRAALARLEVQRFRILQDLNHLRYDYPQTDPETGEIRGLGLALTEQDRQKLLERLERQRTMSWSSIKKELGLPRSVHFNLEEGSKAKGLNGNATACTLRAILGDRWDELGESGQFSLVEDLLKFEKKLPLKNRLIRHWGFDIRTAVQLAVQELVPGHANLSLKAICRLLPFLQQGMIYSDARLAAGYGYEVPVSLAVDRLPPPGDLRNPVVNKALHEFRRVCNALIAVHGRPDAIRIELPRELTMNKRRKAEYEKQQKANQRANDAAKEQYNIVRQANPQLGLPAYPRRDDLIKYRLWQEQGQVSAYSGKTIGITQLFSAVVEIDHILPYSRTLDDSYMNKVIAFADENRDKGNHTPWEKFSGNGEAWEHMVQRVRPLPMAKRKRFLQETLDTVDDFINSQLSDTAYISREVTGYVRQLGCDVSVGKGQMTAWLRHQWGLNSLLGGSEKNRADHRHHTIDAVVTAVVSRSLYQRVVHLAQQEPAGATPDDLSVPPPMNNFREVVTERLNCLIVSHDPIRKLTGAFHEDTAYGVQKDGDVERVVYRKPLGPQFEAKHIAKVLDPALRQILMDHLARFGNDPKVAFSPANLPRPTPGAAPIRHVRVIAAESYNRESFLPIRDARGGVMKLHPFGNNHHVEILRDKKTGKYRGVFVTTWQAAQRARQEKRPLVKRDHGCDMEFVMALHINDQVSVKVNGEERVYRVQKLDPANNRVVLRLHTAATLDIPAEEIAKSISTLIETYFLSALHLNVLGHRLDDQTDR